LDREKESFSERQNILKDNLNNTQIENLRVRDEISSLEQDIINVKQEIDLKEAHINTYS
jgi:hypothetical protein